MRSVFYRMARVFPKLGLFFYPYDGDMRMLATAKKSASL